MPEFVEETGLGDMLESIPKRKYCIVWKFGRLLCVARTGDVREGEAAIDNDVAVRTQGVGINKDWEMIGGFVAAARNFQLTAIPTDWWGIEERSASGWAGGSEDAGK